VLALNSQIRLSPFPGSLACTFGLDRLIGALHFTDQPDLELWVRGAGRAWISLNLRLVFQYSAPMSIPR
jgi:hypothetical protein